jgi:adenosine deaminase
MMDHGLRLTINSDDPPFHHTDPVKSYMMMVQKMGATVDDIREFVVNSIDGSWAPEWKKAEWRAEWLETFDALRSEYLD